MLDFNFDVIDGKEVQLDQLLSSIETFPFMDDRKVVIVKDFELFSGNKKNFTDADEKYFVERLDNIPDTTVLAFIVYGDIDKRKSIYKKINSGNKKNFTDADEKYFVERLDNIPDTTVLAFIVYGDIDKRKSIYKKINKVGIVCECKKLDGMDLFKWVKREFSRLDVNIENSTVAYFIEQLGYRDKNSDMTWVKREFSRLDVNIENSTVAYFIEQLGYRDKNSDMTLTDVKNEIFKMGSYAGAGSTLTNEIVDKLSPRKVENNVFRMIDNIGMKNASIAMKIFKDMVFYGEPVLRIMSLISRQFRIILKVKDMQKENIKFKEIIL